MTHSNACPLLCGKARPARPPLRPPPPNAATNCSLANNSPSSSRARTGNGISRRPRCIARIASATCGDGSGHGHGCTDTETLQQQPGRGETGHPHDPHRPPSGHGPQPTRRELTSRVVDEDAARPRPPEQLLIQLRQGLWWQVVQRGGRHGSVRLQLRPRLPDQPGVLRSASANRTPPGWPARARTSRSESMSTATISAAGRCRATRADKEPGPHPRSRISDSGTFRKACASAWQIVAKRPSRSAAYRSCCASHRSSHMRARDGETGFTGRLFGGGTRNENSCRYHDIGSASDRDRIARMIRMIRNESRPLIEPSSAACASRPAPAASWPVAAVAFTMRARSTALRSRWSRRPP